MATISASPRRQSRLATRLNLQRNLRRLDVMFFAVAAIIGLDTLGAVASDGAQAFTWMVFLAVLFFLPYALLTAELGSAFPAEGGPYVWVRLAFGRLAGSLTAIFYWVSNPIWLGGTLAVTSMAVIGEFFTPLGGVAKYVFGLAFIWAGVAAVIVSTRYGKWIPNFGAFLRMGLLGFFTISVIVYAGDHGLHGFGGSAFSPTYAIFIAAVPVLAFNYVGCEVPCAAGEEIENPQRAVPIAVMRSAVISVLLYAVPILAILLILPTSQVTNLGGFIDAIKTVFTVYGGHVTSGGTATLTGAGKVLGDLVAIAFILALLTGAVAWLMGADRAQAIAAHYGSAPGPMGRFSARFGTPITVNLLSGVVATVFMILALALTSGNVAKYFSAVLGVVISTTLISYIGICPAVIRLRYTHGVVTRPYRVPSNLAVWACGLLGTFWSIFATVVLVWPGIGTSDPGGALPTGFTNERLQYELTQLVPLAVIVVIGVAFYLVGRVDPASQEAVWIEPASQPATAVAGAELGGEQLSTETAS